MPSAYMDEDNLDIHALVTRMLKDTDTLENGLVVS